MQFLPLRYIHEDDQNFIGEEFVKLARLYKLGFPVADLVIISPPLEAFKKILGSIPLENLEFSEIWLDYLKEKALKIKRPYELDRLFREKKSGGSEKVWQELLIGWTFDLKSFLQREQNLDKLEDILLPKEVVFTKDILASGISYFVKSKSDTKIKIQKGKLSPSLLRDLDQITEEMSKKLILPVCFHWILEKDNKPQLKMIKISPIIDLEDPEDPQQTSGAVADELRTQKSAVKIVLNLMDFTISKEADAILIDASQIQSQDKQILSLVEAAITFPHSPVIFKLSDIFEKEVEAFLFAREKKSLPNLHLALSGIHTFDQFLQKKRDLSKFGFDRRGFSKLWVDFSVPENIINVEEYINSGFDGVLVDLDSLYKSLTGTADLMEKSTKVLASFLDNFIRKMHQAKLPIIAKGELALDADLMPFLIKSGIWGVCVDLPNSLGLYDHLRALERGILQSEQ